MGLFGSIARIGGGILGNAFLPGLGGLAGSALGGALGGAVANLFGGGGGNTAQAAAPTAGPGAGRGRLMTLLEGDAAASPFQGATYRAGLGDLNRQMGEQARTDAASAAARGLTGSEFEIAQAGNRARTAAGDRSALLGAAMQQQQNARSGLLALLQQEEAARQGDLGRRQQGQAGAFNAIGSIASAAAPSVIDILFGGSGGGAQS